MRTRFLVIKKYGNQYETYVGLSEITGRRPVSVSTPTEVNALF